MVASAGPFGALGTAGRESRKHPADWRGSVVGIAQQGEQHTLRLAPNQSGTMHHYYQPMALFLHNAF